MLRAGSGGDVEVYLQRRHRKATFMSSAFVFPGGAADADEDDLRLTAARELFEEAGVLLAPRHAHDKLGASAPALAEWRQRLNANTARFDEVAAGVGVGDSAASLELDQLSYFAHWITPSVEPKRFSAEFFLARLPPGQSASPDHAEMVDEAWVTPAEALARAGELCLPPPQVRIFFELRALLGETAPSGASAASTDDDARFDALWRAAAERARHRHPIMPRLMQRTAPLTLLLPWDPDYATLGTGEALEMPAEHPLAVGPSRFVRENNTWIHTDAASSPSAG
ncbi:MAG: hypothetical protein Tsb0020_43190 [Haliangiales bacterium]